MKLKIDQLTSGNTLIDEFRTKFVNYKVFLTNYFWYFNIQNEQIMNL